MSKLKILSDSDSVQGKNQQKGKLFEKLMAEVLKHYGYQIDRNPSVNYAGMEIDIEGKHIATDIPLYAECKFYENEIDSPKIQAFFGKYMAKWGKCKKTHGIFIAIPGLNSHAKGFYHESIEPNSEITLKLFEEEHVLDAIFDSGLIVGADVIAQKIPKEVGEAGDWNIIYSDKGYFWLQYVIKAGDVIPRYVALFDGKGNVIGNAADVKYIIDNIPELKDFEILPLSTPINSSHQTTQDIEVIVEVRGSDACFEYQFPASPQYYVGRENILKEFNDFTAKVVNGEVASRGVYFEANSGWGKSSTVLKCVESLTQNGHISIAIDSRSASSSRFVLNVVKYVIESKSVVDLMKSEDNTISGYDGAFKMLEKVSDRLKPQNKLLVIFYDQFENIFYKQETLKNICNLFLKICDKKLNIVFGFSWKSDLIGLTSEFPFELRDSISSQSQCISLGIFSEQEINCLLDKLSKEIKSSLRNDLKFFLSEYSQGYPWLLKKLCAHVKAQRDKGISQADIATGVLNVEELFKADMIGLSSKEESALRSIAKSAPISVNEIGEEFRLEIIQPLITKRLVVKIGHKYDIYWDIFRDYLNSGKLPEQENYIIRSPIQSVYKVTKALTRMGQQKIEAFQGNTGLSKRTLFNVAKDMELLGISKIKNGLLSLNIEMKDDKEFDKLLRTYLNDNLKRNRLINKILQQLVSKGKLSLQEVAAILEESCPYIAASKNTWLSYARNFMGWMDSADLVLVEKGNILKYEHGTQIRENKFVIRKRSGSSIIQYSPMEEILCRMVNAAKTGGRIDWDGLARSTISKSLAVLETIGFISREDKSKTINLFQDAFIFVGNVTERPRLFAEKAIQHYPMFKYFIEVLNENAKIENGLNLNDLGIKLKQKLNADWAISTAKTNAKILMDWAKHTNLAPNNYALDRRGRRKSE
ncbi:MAG: restriction endonuclease [Elusimicrobia bacterium]|nr:restriction endonuclease [Candidatus Liberimonas magnetica]